jgi:hypothetical protein
LETARPADGLDLAVGGAAKLPRWLPLLLLHAFAIALKVLLEPLDGGAVGFQLRVELGAHVVDGGSERLDRRVFDR